MFWFNGEIVAKDTLELAIDEPGLLYGATIFTTLRVYEKSLDHPLTQWDAHCQRLATNCNDLGWQFPNWKNVRRGALFLASDSPILRLTIFPDGREWLIGRSLPPNLAKQQQEGIKAWVAPVDIYQRTLPQQKTGNYLTCWLAKKQAQEHAAQEAILTDAEGNWLETTTGNLWGWKDGKWWTPPLGNILPGIARSRLLKNLAQVNETPWTSELIETFDLIAYTNSVFEIIPIHTVITSNKQLVYKPQHYALSELHKKYLT